MNVGEKADIKVNAIDAYGEYYDDALQVVPKEQFVGVDLEVRMALYGQGEDGQNVQVIVKEIKDDGITVDFNHPLAGKDLMFSVDIVDIRRATQEELISGQIERASGCGCGSHNGSCSS
jgi:FKBP-type peptidyl-prolyl cis-trans isomerase SlyD